MEYRRLGNSGLRVSEIGLGGNNFGARIEQEACTNIVNQALEMGINFFDTAELYAQGRSEELVGQALKGKRSRVIIATKFGHPGTVRPDQQGGSRSYIMKAVDSSLKRLGTDYIDLYYLHFPDPETPIQETLHALDDLVRTGKVRYIGCSNFAAWQLGEALWTSRLNQLEAFIAVQSRYNLLDRSIEEELVPCSQTHGVGIIPWGPLAGGFLTGKYRRGEKVPAGVRLAKPPPIYTDVLSDANFDRIEKLEALARERGHGVLDLAIAWLLSHPWLGSIIAGVMNVEQLSANVAAAGWRLTPEDAAQVDKIP
jgi:aryl-alcohol dehydrogenase-like predicted oxidoreductase